MNMKHERIVKFIGAGSIMHPQLQDPVLFLVQEFMSGGSLDKRLWHTPLSSVSWTERMQWLSDVAEGLQHIHSQGFAHRDIKSQNILYDSFTGRAKVADFGTTRSVRTVTQSDEWIEVEGVQINATE